MLRFKGSILLKAFFLLIGLLIETTSWASDIHSPFHSKERLVFKVRWAFIHAGDVVLEILPTESIEGVQAYHFVMSARTTEFVDFFYQIRDRVDSYTDISMTHSFLYMKEQHGHLKNKIVVDMDCEKGWARYSNFGKSEEPIPIQPGSFDPLSIFYAFRAHQLKENIVIQIPVTDGQRCLISNAKVIKREPVQVPGGIFDTYLVEPEMGSINGIFKKSENAKLLIWVTADARQMPVKIKSGVKVGSFIAELVSYEMGSHY
ncbi:MAG: DUF3108 domain-containing protein [Deltaproteobacteria bacterium]|nr:DUF3108 domain-containing protein [Deltaproteobacteria bacterium]